MWDHDFHISHGAGFLLEADINFLFSAGGVIFAVGSSWALVRASISRAVEKISDHETRIDRLEGGAASHERSLSLISKSLEDMRTELAKNVRCLEVIKSRMDIIEKGEGGLPRFTLRSECMAHHSEIMKRLAEMDDSRNEARSSQSAGMKAILETLRAIERNSSGRSGG